MSRDAGFHEYIMNDVLGGMSSIKSRAMFGGWGIYKDGIFFALIADGELYFKVDDSNRADYEKRGSKPFIYSMRDGKKTTMSYWPLPGEIMEDRQELEVWIGKSVKANMKDKKSKVKKKQL